MHVDRFIDPQVNLTPAVLQGLGWLYMLLFGMTPQQAIEAPRFRSSGGLAVAIEDRVAPEALTGLESRGHNLRVIAGWTATFGGAQMIFYDPVTEVLTAAADPRREAYSLAY